HRSFLHKPQTLVYLTGRELPVFAALQQIRDGKLELPDGCNIDIETEAIDMMASLALINAEALTIGMTVKDNAQAACPITPSSMWPAVLSAMSIACPKRRPPSPCKPTA